MTAAVAASAIVDHHHALQHRLHDLADAVIEAVTDGDDGTTEAVVLFSWYRNDLLPQFKATEAALYSRGRERETTSLLVQSLIAGQAQLTKVFEELESVDEPGPAAAAAGAAKALFDEHLAKESGLLIPALVKIGVDFDSIIADRPELVGGDRRREAVQAQVVTDASGAAPTIAPVTGVEELDVRPLAHNARHGMILGKMQALTATGALVLINDHDPLPLKYQAEAMWPGEFEWTYLDEGPEEWRVSIARV